LECADSIGGQLCGDKECPFSDVTSSGTVWRKVPESDAWSVLLLKAVLLWEPRVQNIVLYKKQLASSKVTLTERTTFIFDR